LGVRDQPGHAKFVGLVRSKNSLFLLPIVTGFSPDKPSNLTGLNPWTGLTQLESTQVQRSSDHIFDGLGSSELYPSRVRSWGRV